MINSAAVFNTLLASDDKQKCASELKEICQRFKQNDKKFSDDYDAELFLWRFIHPTDFIKWHDKDVYFNPKFDRLAWFLAAGDSPEVYEKKIREYNDAVTCGLVWTQNYLAYRCRTCSSTLSMALCTECFLNGQHEGHDFNMFRSQAGGACDCGDLRVMRESGFCSKHGTNALKTKRKAPEELFTTVDVLLPHLIKCILLVFASSYKPEYVDEIQILTTSSFKPAERLVAVLQKFSDCGAAAKERLSAMLLDTKSYQDFTEGVSHFQDESDFMCAARDRYKAAVKSSNSICSKEDAESLDCPLACCDLEHSSFLAEMVFWLIKLRMPQPLVTLLLSLLPCDEFKTQFINLFATHYSRMIMMLIDESRTVSSLGGDPTSEAISNRVVHISVQLLSNDSIALRMCTEHKFVRVLVASLYNTIKRCLVESTLNTVSDNFHLVADCRHRLMENQSYWVTSHDLRNILSHKEVALNFLRDPPLLDVFAALVSTLQGINPNTRELSGHVEYESRSYFAAFSAELELCSLVSRTLLEHLKDQDSFDCILSMLQNVTCQIQDWFDAIHFAPPFCWKPPLLECCFHFPLHRLWASFLCQGLKLDMHLNLPSETFLRQLMMHPLSIQVARTEIHCDMWIRNGASIKYQSYFYVHNSFMFLDFDLYLLQVCATKVNPEWLILTFFERFHLIDWLSFSPIKPIKKFLRSEWESPMLGSCLKLIASLVTNRINLGLNEKDCLRMEIASLLCQNDKSHSQIMDSLSHTTLSSKAQYAAHIEEILMELADYVAPQFVPGGAMSEGIYTPKSVVWEKYFDPLFLSLRIVQPKDFQTAMNRYKKYLKTKSLIDKESASIIPPYRLPGESSNGSAMPVYDNLKRILNSRSLHSIVFVILLKALSNENNVSENVLSLAVYLLRLILFYTVDERKQCNVVNVKPANTFSQRPNVLDLQFCGWFASNCIFENLTQTIQNILYIDNVPGLSRWSCQTETEHGDFPDLERLRARTIRTRVYAEPPEGTPVFSPEDHPYRSKASKALDIPFIDSSMDLDTTVVYEDSDPDMLYNRAVAYIPRQLRLHYSLIPRTISQEDEPSTSGMIVEEQDSENEASSSEIPALGHQERLAIEGPTLSDDQKTIALKSPGEMVTSDVAGVSAMDVDESRSNFMVPQARRALHENQEPKPKALPQPHVFVNEINQSMLSLLLSLYRKHFPNSIDFNNASDKSGIYKPRHQTPNATDDFRTAFDVSQQIRQLLDEIYEANDGECRRKIDEICEKMRQSDKEKEKMTADSTKDTAEREQRRKSTNDRKERLMAQFKSKQKNAFDKHVKLETMLISSKSTGAASKPDAGLDSDMKPKSEFDDILKLAETEYEQDSHKSVQCVICGAPAVPTSQYPLALIVSAQATSILGKCYVPEAKNLDNQSFSDPRQTFERQLENFSRRKTKSVLQNEFKDRCSATYSESVFYQNTNNIWHSGVFVQTCGHYVHVDCHENYIATLRNDSQLARYSILQIERGEFNCPLCRRFSNAVLPIVPKIMKEKSAPEYDFADSIKRILSTLEVYNEDDLLSNSKLQQVENDFVASMKACSHPQFMMFNDDYRTNDCSFLCDLARANLEIVILLMQEGLAPSRLCISELLNLIVDGFGQSLTVPLLVQMKKDWSVIKGLDALSSVDIENVKTLALAGRPAPQMPLMSRDLTATYLRYAFGLMVKNCSLGQFHALTDIFCAMISLQICLNFVRDLNLEERKKFLPKRPLSLTQVSELGSLSILVSYLVQNIEKINDIDQMPLIDMECADDSKMVPHKGPDRSSISAAVPPVSGRETTEKLESIEMREFRKSENIDVQRHRELENVDVQRHQELENVDVRERRESDNVDIHGRRQSDIVDVHERRESDNVVDVEMAVDSGSSSAIKQDSISVGSTGQKTKEDHRRAAAIYEDSATTIGDQGDMILDTEIYYESETKLRSRLTPFLRLAALLKIYGDFSTILSPTTDESVQISSRKILDKIFATATTNLDDLKEFTTSNRRWLYFGDNDSSTNGSEISQCLRAWLNDAKFFEKTGDCLLNTYPLPSLSKPRLLPLPKFYDVIFRQLYQRPCPGCQKPPKESLLCLLCAKLVCNGDACCTSGPSSRPVTEAESHAVECGAGTCVYLGVHTSSVVVVRRKRGAVWGSLYLDAYGEEDRGLQRGKPLTLSVDRIALLERQYLTHSFDDTCKRWYWLFNANFANVIPL